MSEEFSTQKAWQQQNRNTKECGILMDVGHLYQAWTDLDETVRLFKRRLLDIHVHDAMRDKDYRKATHLPIGKGTIDFPRLIDLLRQVSYDGWLTLEVRGNEQEIVRSREYLENLVGSSSMC